MAKSDARARMTAVGYLSMVDWMKLYVVRDGPWLAAPIRLSVTYRCRNGGAVDVGA